MDQLSDRDVYRLALLLPQQRGCCGGLWLMRLLSLWWICLSAWAFATSASILPSQVNHGELGDQLGELYGNATRHTNNWAVLVCASRFWFNYRHMANTLAMYRTIKRLGIPDSNIILMLADDVACNARNSFPATVYASAGRKLDLYGEGIEVDYRGYEVTVESFLRLLTGRHESHVPASKRLLTDASSNVFIYMTGHGGNEFLKFQDNEEVSAFDIADAVEQMWEKRRYNRLLYVIDTCQANSMYSKFYSPNIISTGSSMVGENSYSHHNDHDIGVAVIDAYTHFILAYLETIVKTSKATLQDFFNTYDPARIKSHPGVSTELSPISPADTLVTDFFGGVASVEITGSEAKLPLRMAPAPWRTVRRGKTIGDDKQLDRRRTAQSPRMPDVPDGWKRPLEARQREIWPTWFGGMLLSGLVGVVAWTAAS